MHGLLCYNLVNYAANLSRPPGLPLPAARPLAIMDTGPLPDREGAAVLISERTDPFMNSLETFTNQLIQHGTDLGAKLLSALVVLVIGLWLCRWVIRLVQHSRALDKLDPSLHTFLTSCTRIVLYVLLGLNVAGILGIQTTSFLTLLASGSVAVGLALQGALSNFAGGLMLLIFKPFKVGDYIKADGQEGTVKAVTVFYTFLTTPDNKVVTLPNGSLTGTAVVNYTANPTRLLMQTYTASYDAPVEKVKAVLLETARANPMVLADPAPMARLARHGDSALEYTLRVWCNSADYWPLNFDLMEQVRNAFDKAGIEIPYPQMDVHTR